MNIRKPRFHISNSRARNTFRFQFKVGDIVWHDRGPEGPKQYRIIEVEDWFYETGIRPKVARRKYSIFYWLRPLKRQYFRVSRKAMKKDVMIYNEALWKAGNIGHSLSYDEIFHTEEECMFNRVATYHTNRCKYKSLKGLK